MSAYSIYGDRGLGKSSLAVQAQLIAMGDATLLTHIGVPSYAITADRSFITLFVACTDEARTLNDVVQLMINAADNVISESIGSVSSSSQERLVDRQTRRKISLRAFEAESTKRYEASKERASYARLSPSEQLQHLVRLLNDHFRAPVLMVIDELDRVSDKSGLGSFLKALTTDDLKFLLVGIAQDWTDLLLDHASVERQVVPVLVPRMRAPELAEIIDRAQTQLEARSTEFRFTDEARTRLVRAAGGFPWFIHVIGQAALLEAIEQGTWTVSGDHVITALRGLVKNRFAQQFADTYQRAVRDSVNREIVLRVLAAWRTADIPTADVYRVCRRLGVTNPAVYRGHLAAAHYGSAIMTPGYQDRGLVRFRNEMFKQYVFMTPSLFQGVAERVAGATVRF